MPYKIPLLEVRSKETKGKMEETGEEFIRVFISNLSEPKGRTDSSPSAC